MGFAAPRRWVAFGLVSALAGCSTATIARNYGPPYEARITGSDARSLRVRDDHGYEFVVPREDVRDVDHPGNVLLTIGGILAGVYTPLTIAALSSDRGGEWSGLAATVWGTAAVTGIALALGGLVPYLRWKGGAAAF